MIGHRIRTGYRSASRLQCLNLPIPLWNWIRVDHPVASFRMPLSLKGKIVTIWPSASSLLAITTGGQYIVFLFSLPIAKNRFFLPLGSLAHIGCSFPNLLPPGRHKEYPLLSPKTSHSHQNPHQPLRYSPSSELMEYLLPPCYESLYRAGVLE